VNEFMFAATILARVHRCSKEQYACNLDSNREFLGYTARAPLKLALQNHIARK
jgi:hypothetical protein